MTTKRRKTKSITESDLSSSDDDDYDDDDILYSIPDPNYSGDDSEDSETEDSNDSESESSNESSQKKTYWKASKNYEPTKNVLEEGYVYEWVDREKPYGANVKNTCLMPDAIKKKN